MSAGMGGWLVVKVRRANTQMFGLAGEAVSKGKFFRMGSVHLAGILLSFTRGFVTVFVIFYLSLFVHDLVAKAAISGGPGPALLIVPFTALGAASALKSYVTKKRVLHVLLGGLVTLLILYLS
jgi:hypothetical protein